MRYLTFSELLEIHRGVIERGGGSLGIRDHGLARSALAQPCATFGGVDLYPGLQEKAAALCFSLVSNHPFIDGNKRVGHAALQIFLRLNGKTIEASVDENEAMFLRLAAGEVGRDELLTWIELRITDFDA